MSTDLLAEVCPACLTELPAGYPYDHVAIDQALTCHRDWARARFRALSFGERGELVRVAQRRGITLNALYRRFAIHPTRLRALAAAEERTTA